MVLIVIERKIVCKCAVISIGIALLVALIVLLILFYGKSGSLSSRSGPKIVIDHDGGADDAMAIFLALLYEEYFQGPTILALTTCNGNVNEEQVYNNSQLILDIAKRRDVPIYRGSKQSIVKTPPTDAFFGIDGLGDLKDVQHEHIPAAPEHAVLALIEMSKKYKGELTVVVIGALTNIALAVRLDPDFINRLAHLYIAAGHIYSKDHPDPEFNALMDVEAYYAVAESSTSKKVTFIPFSPIQDKLNMTMDWRVNVLGAINTTIMQHQVQFERIANNGSSNWHLLDPLAMAMVLDEDLVEKTKCSNNSIVLCGKKRGINTNDFIGCTHSNVKLAYPAAQLGFETFLYDVFSAELEK